jgi:hypothetical protein
MFHTCEKVLGQIQHWARDLDPAAGSGAFWALTSGLRTTFLALVEMTGAAFLAGRWRCDAGLLEIKFRIMLTTFCNSSNNYIHSNIAL